MLQSQSQRSGNARPDDVSNKTDQLGIAPDFGQYSALLNNTNSAWTSKLGPSLLKSDAFQKEMTPTGTPTQIAEVLQKSQIAAESSQVSSHFDWSDSSRIKRQVVKQNQQAACKQFDPFSYFGALDMPEITSEDIPAHPRIENIFKTPQELQSERRLPKKSGGSGGNCQNYSNAYPTSLTFSTAAHKVKPTQQAKNYAHETAVLEIPCDSEVQAIVEGAIAISKS